MYLPRHFEQTDRSAIDQLIQAHPLGALVVVNSSEGLTANHIPFELSASEGQHGVLRGHIARANPLWKIHTPYSPVLVIFQGLQAHIVLNYP
jgi:transcriptional regulator